MLEYILTYQCKDKADRDAFYSALCENSIAALCEKEQGCLKYAYYFPTDSKSSLVLVEIWEEKADQLRHTEQEHFKIIQELKAKYVTETDCEAFEG